MPREVLITEQFSKKISDHQVKSYGRFSETHFLKGRFREVGTYRQYFALWSHKTKPKPGSMIMDRINTKFCVDLCLFQRNWHLIILCCGGKKLKSRISRNQGFLYKCARRYRPLGVSPPKCHMAGICRPWAETPCFSFDHSCCLMKLSYAQSWTSCWSRKIRTF